MRTDGRNTEVIHVGVTQSSAGKKANFSFPLCVLANLINARVAILIYIQSCLRI